MITIGITGGIATGKSEVARLLALHGARIIDADRVAHETYRPDTPGYEAIVARFGTDVLTPDREVDRGALGRLVFADPEALKTLTAIIWPLTRARVEELKREAEAAGVALLAIEVVALREAGWQDLVDLVWLVTAPREYVIERLRRRGGLSEPDAEARIAAQAAHAADTTGIGRIIRNDGDLAGLEAQVDAALRDALSAAAFVPHPEV